MTINLMYAEILNVSQTIVLHRLKKLGKVSKLGVWVPHNLIEQNKVYCKSITASLLSLEKRKETSLDRINTGDGEWISYES